MAAPASVVDSDDSSDSHPSILIARAVSPSTSTSSTSSDPQSGRSDWTIRYCKLPKKRSLSFRFMTWAAGRPRKANYMKKKYRDKDIDPELFRVSTTTLVSSVLGRWPRETKMYWLTTEAEKDHEKKKDGMKEDDDTHVMSAGLGNGTGAEGVPIYHGPPPGVGIPFSYADLDPRLAGTGVRLPPGMANPVPPTA